MQELAGVGRRMVRGSPAGLRKTLVSGRASPSVEPTRDDRGPSVKEAERKRERERDVKLVKGTHPFVGTLRFICLKKNLKMRL